MVVEVNLPLTKKVLPVVVARMPMLLKSPKTSPPPPLASTPQTIAPDAFVSRTEVPEQEGRLVLKVFAKIPPVNVDVAEPFTLSAPPTYTRPDVSITPFVVVAFPTPRPPVM